jgi:hypothetical protein
MGASAMVARMMLEAPGGPSTVNSIGATGIFQALGDRRPPGFETWSYGKQLDYLWGIDLQKPDRRQGLDVLKTGKTPEEGSTGAAMIERAEGPFGHDVLGRRRRSFNPHRLVGANVVVGPRLVDN